MEKKLVTKKLEELQIAINSNTLLVSKLKSEINNSKRILNVDELSEYIGFSKSYIYKLVARNEIAYSKPLGKKLFFDKRKIDDWLMQKSSISKQDIQQKAESYVFSKK